MVFAIAFSLVSFFLCASPARAALEQGRINEIFASMDPDERDFRAVADHCTQVDDELLALLVELKGIYKIDYPGIEGIVPKEILGDIPCRKCSHLETLEAGYEQLAAMIADLESFRNGKADPEEVASLGNEAYGLSYTLIGYSLIEGDVGLDNFHMRLPGQDGTEPGEGGEGNQGAILGVIGAGWAVYSGVTTVMSIGPILDQVSRDAPNIKERLRQEAAGGLERPNTDICDWLIDFFCGGDD